MKKYKLFSKRNNIIAFSSVALILIIFLYQEPLSKSELRFTEGSLSAGKVGNVIPASCASNVNHSAPGANPPDCDQICINASNPMVVANTQFSIATGSCVCKNGKTNPPNCTLPSLILSSTRDPKPTITLTTDSGTDINNKLEYGDSTYVRWSSTNANSCDANWGTGLNPSGSYFTGAMLVTKNVSITCKNATRSETKSVTVYVAPYVYDASGCFTKGTLITMTNGEKKDIKDVIPGETILSSYGPEQVMKKYEIAYTGKVYAFNGSGNYFVTPTHPFMTTEGWKSLDPEGSKKETPELAVTLLTVGDTLIKKDGKLEKLSKLDFIEKETTVYNFGLNGSHDFYADDYQVHNVNLGVFLEKTNALQVMKP